MPGRGQFQTFSGADPDDLATSVVTLAGEGDYEGLVAIMEVDWNPETQTWDTRGFVVDGDLPPAFEL